MPKKKNKTKQKAEETDSRGPASAGCGRNHRPLHPLIPGPPQGRRGGEGLRPGRWVRVAAACDVPSKGDSGLDKRPSGGQLGSPPKPDSPPAAALGDLQDTFGGNRIGGL